MLSESVVLENRDGFWLCEHFAAHALDFDLRIVSGFRLVFKGFFLELRVVELQNDGEVFLQIFSQILELILMFLALRERLSQNIPGLKLGGKGGVRETD